jgi:hypothetical protein
MEDELPKAPIIIASGYFLDLSVKTWGPNVRASQTL